MASRYSLTAAMLEERFAIETLIQLTDGDATYVDATIDKQIESEENDFEGFAGVYYTLPVRTSAAAVPAVVRERLLDGVAIRLIRRKPEFMNDGDKLSAFWSREMKKLEEWKTSLSDPNRKVKIPDGVERTTSTSTASGASVSSDTPLFSGLKGLM